MQSLLKSTLNTFFVVLDYQRYQEKHLLNNFFRILKISYLLLKEFVDLKH